MFVLCPDLFYVLPGSLIDVRNGSIRVFVVQIICDCCRACVDTCDIYGCSLAGTFYCVLKNTFHKKSLKIPNWKSKPYIEEEQTTQ
jgi:hypothetical protein